MELRAKNVLSAFLLAAILCPIPSSAFFFPFPRFFRPPQGNDPLAPFFENPTNNLDPNNNGGPFNFEPNNNGGPFNFFPFGRPFWNPMNGGPLNNKGMDNPANAGPVNNVDTPVVVPPPKQKGLQVGFYSDSCPNAEDIVKQVVTDLFRANQAAPASLLRLIFHDCIVRGCDASVLLDKTPAGDQVEKKSGFNGIFLRGTEVIDAVKTQLEQQCPNTVSCADVIAFATREALNFSGVPYFDIPGGRRDGTVSLMQEADENIPSPNQPVDMVLQKFAKVGLNMEDMVVLLGAHSIGEAHCSTFNYRLKSPNAAQQMDERLMKDIGFTCQENPDPNKVLMAMDSETQYLMDVNYYQQLLLRKGLLEFDQNMADFPATGKIVKQLANDNDGWLQKFSNSFVKMASIGVLTGDQGQVRTQCRFVNQ